MKSTFAPGKSILKLSLFLALTILSNFNLFSQLTGIKTINPTGGDYTTLTSAINDLMTQGINGPVILDVADGTYDEQVSIGVIPGASAINTITIKSQSADSSKVVFTYNSTSSTSNWTLKLNSTDYITLKDITIAATGSTYARCLDINLKATNIMIENCRFIGYNTTSIYNPYALIFSADDTTENITIQNNLFSNGSNGIYMEGYSTSILSTGTQILNNVFTGQSEYGVSLIYQNAPIVNNNTIQTKNNSAYGINLEYCDNSLEVKNNIIDLPSGNYGINLYYCDGADLNRGNVINNSISIQSGSTAVGIFLTQSSYQNIYHNSVSVNAVTTNDYGAFHLTGGSNINVRNNIFANFGENYAYNIKTPSAISFSDYNNYYSNGNYIGFWTNAVENLSDLKTANSKDVNSVSFNPVFVSSTDLHATSFRIDNLGTNLGVATDLEGVTKVNSDIGAYEFTGTGAALAGGTYTIGGASPDFATFSAAAAALNNYGISGPVTFNVRTGAYEEQFLIWPIAGTDVNNPVIFQSESGIPTDVELIFNSGTSNNYLVRLVGADFITFKNMSFSALNTTYSRIIWLSGSASNIEVSSCILNGNTTGVTADALIYSYQYNIKNILIQNNNIFGGRHGVYFNSNSSNLYLKGIKISQNTFTDQKGGYNQVVFLRYSDAPEVSENTIINSGSNDFWGIYLQNCSNDLKVLRNKISSNNSDGGIHLNTCVSINTKRGLIANNIIDIGGTSYAYGINTYDSDYQSILYNSVRIKSTNITYGRALYNSNNSSYLTIKNNILSNFGAGYAFYNEGTTSNFSSDYNDLYTTGNNLAFWNGANHSDLSAYKVASSMDANSISVNPSFISESDLHTTSSFINGAGTNLTEVTTDFDGEARNLTTPDIGADEFTSVSAALAAGTYTIGGSSPDYANFAAAINDLNTLGIAGPIVFNVRNGTYTEQITLLDINGSSATNTITFQSESGDSSLVELSFAANINNKYTVQLIGTDYVSFKNMTISATGTAYALVFYLRGGIKNLSIRNCVLNGIPDYGGESDRSIIYSGNAIVSDFTVENCQITSGRSGIWMESPSASPSPGTIIKNNSFSGQYYDGVFLKYHNAPLVEGNTISNTIYSSSNAIYLQYCGNDFRVLNNNINNSLGNIGVYIYYCSGTTTKKGLVANNFIHVGGTAAAYGIYTYYSDYPRIYYNTVKITSTDNSSGRAFYNINGSNVDVRNNIFSNFGGGYAYYANNTTSVITSDFNLLFNTGNYIGYWNGNYSDFNSFKAASGKEASSISVNPVFVSANDLHSTSSYIDNKGTPLAAVTTDYDGESRSSSTPDIGADEFVATMFPMSGTYTIGGTSPDFASFSLAADSLNIRGVSGPVTFNIRDGSYTEHFELFEIPGASSTNTITFQSETGDSTSVILSYNSASLAENYVIKLTGTDYVTFKNMTIAAINGTYSNAIILNGNVTNLHIFNNIISLNNNSSYYGNGISSSDGNIITNLMIKNNVIIEGGYGIYLDGNNTIFSQNVEISGNVFSNQDEYAIYLIDHDSPVIKGNTIASNEYSVYAIYLDDCDNKLIVAENTINLANYSYGIYIYRCNGTLINQGLIANNLVSISSTDYAYGITLSNSEYQNIYFNSVNIASSYSSANYKLAFYLTGGANINVKNNIFANTKGGYAYYITTPAAIISSDYNNFFSTTDLAFWGSARTDLAALRTANSLDSHSLSANPLFVSDNDLRVLQTQFIKAATPIAEVTKDFFGNPRDASLPDIGAVEFYCTTPVFNVSASETCLGDSTLLTDKSKGIAIGSTYSYDFDNDFNPDTTFTTNGSIIRHLFTQSGANTVNLIVSQLGGCNDFFAVNATVFPSPVISVTASGALCNSNNGSASLTITEATGPYSYLWSNGSTSETASNLAIGNYSVAVKSVNNCVGSQTFEIENALKVTVTQLKPSTCGENDGEASVSVTGGTSPYSYVWSNGDTTAVTTTLSTGSQFVNVTDANGCISLGAINIANDGSGPQITMNSISSISCYGEKTGSIDITVSGGSQPNKIQWSNGAVTEDISGLTAGIYDITVTDNAGCMAAASYTINQPLLLNVSAKVTDASCAGTDGQAVALVGGGTQPYVYEWTGGKSSPINNNLSAGVYSLRVTDFNECTVEVPVLVNNTGGPKVTFKSITGTSCSSANTGAIDINIVGGTPLYTYLWSPGGQTSQDISSLVVGKYEVTVTDATGCIGVNSATISQDPPQMNPLCMVTVDDVTGKNLIIWEKLVSIDVTAYNIYRESSSKEIFQLIATIPVSETSQYLDSIADPSVRSWKYRLSVVDICGNESELSPVHKTIHLTQNLGRNSSINLIWDSYEGFAVSSYKILRYSPSKDWETLSSVPSTLTSYTDLNPPVEENLLYVIEVAHPDGGCSTLKAGTYNTARSNQQKSTIKSTIGVKPGFELNSLNVFPNPAKDVLYLSLNQENLKQVRIDIIDVKGNVLHNFKSEAHGNQFNTNIDISNLPAGIYILRIGSDDNVNFRKLVIE